MKEKYCLILFLLFFVLVLYADTNENPLELSISETQSLINQLILTLDKRHSSHKAVTEFRITKLLESIQPYIHKLFKEKEQYNDFLLPVLNRQLKQTKHMTAYFDHIFSAMVYPIDSPDDDPTPLMTMIKTENRNDVYLTIQNQTLQMLETLGSKPAIKETKIFIKKMEERANTIVGYLEYNKQELDEYLSLAPPIDPKKPPANDLSKLLKKRLDLTANSLSTVIDILESHKVDTLKYREVLIYASGEVNTDVFNVYVIGSLLSRWWANMKDFLYDNAGDIFTKIVVFVLIISLFYLIARLVEMILRRMLKRSGVNLSQLMRNFIVTWTVRLIIFIGFLVSLAQIGFNLGPILAGLGIASVVIGFALQQTLSNIASGILILIYKPYDVGDIITALDVTGIVSDMSLVSTTINSYDNERIVIPNTKIWEDKIDNLTAENERRVDMVFSIHYDSDLEKAENVLHDILDRHPNILKTPKPVIKVHKLNNSSIDIVTRPWVNPYDYWGVYWDVTREVKMRFDEEGIVIPFPQLDVHHYSN